MHIQEMSKEVIPKYIVPDSFQEVFNQLSFKKKNFRDVL